MKSPKDGHWQKIMYDREFANETIGSTAYKKLGRTEASFLIRAVALKKGDRVLDVPCGVGRHAVVFAKRGIHVTGIDISADCISLAKKTCHGLQVDLKTGDMSRLAGYRGKYDACVNLFSSFGYFSTDQKNEEVLRGMITTLKPGGKLVIHQIDRDWLLPKFKPADWIQQDDQLIINARKYDPSTHYNEAYRVAVDLTTGRARTLYHRMRLYSKSETVALMKNAV